MNAFSYRERAMLLVAAVFAVMALALLSGCDTLREFDAESRCDGRWRGFDHQQMCSERIKRAALAQSQARAVR